MSEPGSAFAGLGRLDDHRTQGRQGQHGANLSETEKPKAPDWLAIKAEDTGNYSIKLQWDPVDLNQLCGYRLERSPARKDIWTSAHDPLPELPVTSTELDVDAKPYNVYDFCVRSAIKINRRVNYSDRCYLDDVVAKRQYQPFPPRNIRVESMTTKSVSLTWLQPLPVTDVKPASYQYVIEMCDYTDGNILDTQENWQECCRTTQLGCTVEVQQYETCRFRVSTHNKDKNVSSLPLETGNPEVRITIEEKNGETIKRITLHWPVTHTTVNDLESGSIVFVVSCQDMGGLRELWMNYNLGRLKKFFQDLFALEASLASEVSDTDLDLDIKIDPEDFHACRRHLLLTCPTNRGFRVVNLENTNSKASTLLGLSEDYPVYCKPLLQRTTCSQLDFLDPAMPTNLVTEGSPGAAERSPGATEGSPGTTEESPGTAEGSPGTIERLSGATERSPETTEGSPGTTEGSPGTALETEYETIKNQLESASHEVQFLKSEVRRLKQEKETAEKILLECKEEIKNVTGTNEGMQGTIKELINKLAMMQQEESSKEDKMESLQKEVTRLTQEQEKVQKEKENLTGINKGMKGTIEDLLAEKTKLTNRLAMLESEGQQKPRLQTSTSVDNLSSPPFHTKETERRPRLNSLDLATTDNQDSSFTDWATSPSTKQLMLKMRKTTQTLTGLEAKYEISKHQVELQEGMVRSLQREVTRLTQEQELAQTLLMDNKKKIMDSTGVNKSIKDTIKELLAEKTKLTNKLAMMEKQRAPHRSPAMSGAVKRSLEAVAGSSERMRGLDYEMGDFIVDNYVALTNRLKVKSVLPYLIQGHVLTFADKQRILQKIAQQDQAGELLDTLGRNEKCTTELFLNALQETHQTALIDRLNVDKEGRVNIEYQASETTVPIPAMPGQSFPKQEVTSVLLVNDEYGTSHGGVSTVNRQVAQFLVRHGATVHSTALQASEQDKKCATEDGVILYLPVQNPGDKRTPSLEWLTDYHSIHYPDIPQDLKFIVGHADVTSGAAKSIQETRCRHARLVLFNHDMPEDTEHYKGAKKAMAAGKKVGDILEDTKNADAVFSLGRRIFDHFEAKYKSLGESKPREHLMFLPRPSETFEAISVRPERREIVVLTAGRVTEVERLKGHDLAARAMGEVAEKIPNVTLRVRGIDEDDWEASQKILEENLQSGRIKPTLLPCGTQEDIAQDMQVAHLVLMPSRAEPFGMIGLEAIAAGIPVLISDKSGLADMIKDLINEEKCHRDMRHRIVKTSVNESDLVENAREWANKIADTLEYSELEFKKAAKFKNTLLESKYWEESHQNLLRVCGLIE